MGKWWYTDSSGKRHQTKEGYKHSYNKFHSSDDAKKERASRNSARRSALKSGRVHKGDNKDVHHKSGNPKDNSATNLRVMEASKNRAIREGSRKRGSKRNRANWGK